LERRKGYATQILKLALTEAKKLGIAKALVTCDENNIASKKTILKNNGKFAGENIIHGRIKLAFWIET
jgi:predicted acetyltransferase